MAKTPNPVARSRIYAGGVTGAYTQAAMRADAFTRVMRVRTVPPFGDTSADIAVDEVDEGRTLHAKGVTNGQTMEIVCTRQLDDPGQKKMRAAAKSRRAINLRMDIPNEDEEFDTVYFSVLVMSTVDGMGGAGDTQTVTFSCQPQEPPLDDDGTPPAPSGGS